jgi:hypothetical protein
MIKCQEHGDGVLTLIEKGVINGSRKKKIGVIVSSLLVGSKKLFDFIDDNPMIQMLDFEYVNNAVVVNRYHRPGLCGFDRQIGYFLALVVKWILSVVHLFRKVESQL